MSDSLTDGNYAAALDAIYEACLSPQAWPAVLASLSDLFQCHFADIFTRTHDRSIYRGLAHGLDPDDYQDLFLDTWFKRNVWGLTKPVKDAGEVLSTRQMVEVDALKHTEIYTDYLHPRDLHEGLRLSIWADDVGIQDISLLRSWTAGPFETAEIAAGKRLMPHLQRATAIARRLKYAEVATQAGFQALEAAGFAAFVIDRTGRPVQLNGAAERLIRARDALAVEAGRLVAAIGSETRQLQAAIGKGIRPGPASRTGVSMRLTRPSGKAPLVLTTVPLKPDADWVSIRVPALLVLVADPMRKRPSVTQLSALFNLTEAEAELASVLLQGRDLREIADQTGRSVNTLRNHLARLMSKTESSRQAELLLKLRDIPPVPEISGPGG